MMPQVSPCFRIPNIRSGRIDLADLKHATAELDLADDDLLDVGDLLIVRTNGSEDLIGRAAIIREPLTDRFYFASYLIRFRIVDNPPLREWIALHLESPIARAWVRKNIATSAGQYNISQTSLMKMPIPVPPESEMRASLQVFGELESTRGDVAGDTEEAHRVTPSVR
jgi:type I restriction enzyme, S subunit